MLKLLDTEKFTRLLTPITSTNMVTKTNEFDQNGLFSEIIFGPVGSLDRKQKFSYINLNCKIIHPSALRILLRLDSKIDGIITTEKSYKITKDGEFKEDPDGFTGISSFIKNFKKIVFRSETPEREKLIKVINDFFESETLFIDRVPVIPPHFRDIMKDEKTGDYSTDPLNDKYIKILRQTFSIKSAGKEGVLYDLMNYSVQSAVNEHDEFIKAKIGKKHGLIRSQLLGKRIDFSARGVITSGATLKINEIGVPFRMCVNLFYPFIIHILLRTDFINREELVKEVREYLNTELSVESIRKITQAIQNGDKVPENLYNIIRKCTEKAMIGRYVIAKRDPVLHQGSVHAFSPVITDGINIEMCTIQISAFNADFDGDQVALFHPLSEESQKECKERLMTLYSGNSMKGLNFNFNQDMFAGLYSLTKNKSLNNPPIGVTEETLKDVTLNPYTQVMFRKKVITLGKAIINNLYPLTFRFIDEELKKSNVNNLMEETFEKLGEESTIEIASKMKDLAFKYATLFAPSITLDLLKPSAEVKRLKGLVSNTDLNKSVESLEKAQNVMKKDLEGTTLYDLVASGAAKSWGQTAQMIVAKGFVSDASGKLLDPVKGSFSDGLTPTEFFNAANGSRFGIVNRVLNTADTGYTTRQLIYLLNSVEIDRYLKDCKTTRYLDIKLTDDIISRLNGRFVYKNGVISEFDKSIFKEGETIHLRSPIFCKNLKFCYTCYGRLIEKLKTPYVGLTSAMLIGERGTQLIMRSHHTGGQVTLTIRDILNDIAENNIDMTKDYILKYLKQDSNSVFCLKDCKVTIDISNYYDDGDNIVINEEDKNVWVKGLVAEIEFSEKEKFEIILDYEINLDLTEEFDYLKKNKIILSFKEGDRVLSTSLNRQDIKENILYLKRLLGGREIFKDIDHLFMKLFKIYGGSISSMDLIHLEVLLSQCLRDKNNYMIPARVGKNPDKPVLLNIKTSVFNTSFIQGLAFENVGKAIMTGFVEEKSLEPSIIEKILTGTVVVEDKEGGKR